MAFTGFSQQAFAFFMELGFNNTPQTMQLKRDVFNERVLAPLKELSQVCEQVLFSGGPEYRLSARDGRYDIAHSTGYAFFAQQATVPRLYVVGL